MFEELGLSKLANQLRNKNGSHEPKEKGKSKEDDNDQEYMPIDHDCEHDEESDKEDDICKSKSKKSATKEQQKSLLCPSMSMLEYLNVLQGQGIQKQGEEQPNQQLEQEIQVEQRRRSKRQLDVAQRAIVIHSQDQDGQVVAQESSLTEKGNEAPKKHRGPTP